MKRARCNFVAFVVGLFVIGGAAHSAEPKFPLGKETTYVDGPLDAEGYVDYAAAINQRMSRGITPDENANVLLWQAFGPKPVSELIRKEYFAALGMAVPPADGSYFLLIGDFAKRPEFAKKPDAYEALIEAQKEAMRRPWKAEEFPLIADWLAANERPLNVVRDASRRTKFFDPLIYTPPTDDEPTSLMGCYLPGISVWRDCARALAARAMLRVADERYDDAWDDLLTAHRLNRLIALSPTVVSYLSALSMEGITDSADLGFAAHANLSPARIVKCIDDLERLPPMPTVESSLDIGERFMMLDVVQGLRRDGLKSLRWVQGIESSVGTTVIDHFVRMTDYVPALRDVNRWMDRLVAASRIVDRTARKAEFEQISTDLKAFVPKEDWKRTGFWFGTIAGPPETRGKRIGELATALILPALTSVQQTIDRHHQVSTNRRASFALAAFHAEQGRYPAKLDELAPKYLATVPGDLFSDGPLKYRTTDDGYLLYSVGVNGTDDEGRTADDEPVRQFDDLRVRVSRAKSVEIK